MILMSVGAYLYLMEGSTEEGNHAVEAVLAAPQASMVVLEDGDQRRQYSIHKRTANVSGIVQIPVTGCTGQAILTLRDVRLADSVKIIRPGENGWNGLAQTVLAGCP